MIFLNLKTFYEILIVIMDEVKQNLNMLDKEELINVLLEMHEKMTNLKCVNILTVCDNCFELCKGLRFICVGDKCNGVMGICNKCELKMKHKPVYYTCSICTYEPY
jgi:hypothetical protein